MLSLCGSSEEGLHVQHLRCPMALEINHPDYTSENGWSIYLLTRL